MAAVTTHFTPVETDRTALPATLAQRAGASPAPDTVFELIRSRSAFDALKREWDDLFARCGMAHQVFQTFAWNWHWTRVYLDQDDERSPAAIAVLVGRQAGRVVTLWPMAVERRGGLTEIAWMGEPVSQYGDVLLDPTVADPIGVLRAGWEHLTGALRPDLVRLRKVRADAAIAPLLDQLGTLHTSELEAPFVDLDRAPNFTIYEERFPKRAIRNRRRQMRRLQEAGAVTIKHLDEGAEASLYAAAGIEMKRRWLIELGHVSPALADVRMARFMAEVAAGGEHSAGTRVSVLLSGGTPAAIQIGFAAKRTRALHVIAYDRAFEKMAAGVLHLEEAIRNAFGENLHRLDLLAPRASYKVEWSDGSVAVVDHALGLSLKGRLYARLYLGVVRQRLKGAIERLPRGIRRMVVASHLKAAARRFITVLGIG